MHKGRTEGMKERDGGVGEVFPVNKNTHGPEKHAAPNSEGMVNNGGSWPWGGGKKT